jgi:hypothetical protein
MRRKGGKEATHPLPYVAQFLVQTLASHTNHGTYAIFALGIVKGYFDRIEIEGTLQLVSNRSQAENSQTWPQVISLCSLRAAKNFLFLRKQAQVVHFAIAYETTPRSSRSARYQSSS